MNIPDEKQRRHAVLTDGHAFVRASAGTGKTHTLALRALYLLLTAPFDKRAKGTPCAQLYSGANRAERLRAARAVLRRFVLTTFTRKAAAEMQTRLYGYLDAVASAGNLAALRVRVVNDGQFIEVVEAALAKMGCGEERLGKLQAGAEALGELATELQVCTLHSFAVTVLRRHPIAAGIPPNAQFAEEDDTTLADVAGQVVDRWWQKVLSEPELRGELEKLIRTLPLEDMRAWLEAVYRNRWIADEMDFGRPDQNTVSELIEASRQLAPALEGAGGNAKKVIQAGRELNAILAGISSNKPFAWRDFCGFLVNRYDVLFGPRRAKVMREAIASLGALRPPYENYDATYAAVLQKCLAQEYKDDWARWRRFVGRFAAWSEDAAVRELGIVTFDDMVRLAARVLRQNPAVRREERERLWAVLVDEFQDTDPTQLDLLESLLGRKSPTDHEVSGFFVGDRKQSVYRFRGADLAAIDKFVCGYQKMVQVSGVPQFQLTASFRSRKPITDFVNHFFETSVPLPNYGQERLEPVREEAGPAPEWRLLDLEKERDQASKLLESAAWETARLIEEHHTQSGNDDKAYSDIVVLVRTHDELDLLLPLLEEAGIPVVSSGAKTFYQQPEVLDVLSLLVVAHNPQDTLAAGALLRSPLFGLSDAQIHRLLQEMKLAELFHGAKALPAGMPAQVCGRVEQMRRLVHERPTTALATWLRQLRKFIPVGFYAQQNPEGRGVARIDQVLAAFRRAVELGSIPPLTWLLEQRDRARDTFDPDFGEDVSVTDESMAAVRALTIHKAKGLQGKYVIVFGWQKALDKLKPKAGQDRIFHLTDDDGHHVRGFELQWGRLLMVSPRYGEARQLDQQYEAEEAKRLTYVAATRAEDRLVLLSPHTEEIAGGLLADAKPLRETGEASMPVYNGSLIVTVIPRPERTERARGNALRIHDPKAYSRLWRARLEAVAGEPEPLLHKPSSPEQEAEKDETDLSDYVREKIELASERAMEAGTLVHRYLERYLTDDVFEAAKLEQIVSELSPRLRFPESLEKANGVLSAFYGGQYHQRARRARIEAREAPMFLSWEGRAWSGVIDLVLSENSTVKGVDYKVMKRPKRLPAEYEQQQRVYTEALQRVFPEREVSFEFWWLTGAPR